jgi:DHA2 family multidrug resistance protein
LRIETNVAFSRAPSLAIWGGFSAMCAGMFMAVLDIQIVAASLPTIQAELGIRPDQMSWVQTSYLIAEVVAIPLAGVLTRALTMRWLSVITISAFTLASAGCAFSGSLETLLIWRVFQGLAGGLLIPQVFSAGFALFPGRGQAAATTIGGVLAVLAPTLGPIIGGWITDTYSWPWLFLINIVPGILAAITGAMLLPREKLSTKLLWGLDCWGLVFMAVALASFEVGLKQAPQEGWASIQVLGLLAASAVATWLFVRRSLRKACPIVELHAFADRRFALGCMLSFILGISLYGMVYLMPVFLAFVRGHDAFEIGQIMIVTGLAQLLMAPLVVAAEKWLDCRLLTAAGFALFAAGLWMSSDQTRGTDFDEMVFPQIVRGAAIMLCLLPPIRVALAHLPPEEIANASGLFNLMRNLGGAIGIALIDTVMYGRAPIIGERLGQALERGEVAAARAVGLPMDRFFAHLMGTPVEPGVMGYVRAAVEREAMTQSINEAWAVMAALTLVGALLILASVVRMRRPARRQGWIIHRRQPSQ